MNESDDYAIRVHKVRKSFILPEERVNSLKQLFVRLGRTGKKRRQVVLKGMSFDISPGEFVGIVGRNGNGKSTLLKILAGVYSPDTGSVEVRGKLAPFIELGVGFNPELTGRDNVFLNGALLGFTHKEMEAMYDSIVEFAELGSFMDRKLKNYSSGMQVRLAFSIAIKAKSDVLLIDEVLAVGDAAFQQKCFNHFEELRRQQRTVVFVSHDMGAVRRFCSRAIYIENGRMVKDGAPSDVADLYTEANIEKENNDPDELNLSSAHSIKAKITKQDNEKLVLRIDYSAPKNEKVYVGIAITQNGASIGEITTSHDEPLRGEGTVTYTLDKTVLNPGMYSFGTSSLFRIKNRELVAIDHNKIGFTVKGSDPTRGAALKLADTWRYEGDGA